MVRNSYQVSLKFLNFLIVITLKRHTAEVWLNLHRINLNFFAVKKKVSGLNTAHNKLMKKSCLKWSRHTVGRVDVSNELKSNSYLRDCFTENSITCSFFTRNDYFSFMTQFPGKPFYCVI